MQLKQRPGGGEVCWSGHTLGHGALAGIALACVFGVGILVALPVAVCWWRWRREQKQKLQVLTPFIIASKAKIAPKATLIEHSTVSIELSS